MSWLVNALGQEVDLRHPRADSMPIAAVAHSLAMINRFTGHTCRPYSVAEHSLLVSEIAERVLRLDVHGQFAALMHDAHECITGDLSSPMKAEVGAAWHQVEDRIEAHLRSAYALHGPSATHRTAIKCADLMARATERAQLVPVVPGQRAWDSIAGIEPIGWVDLMDPARCAMSWRDWRQAFIDRYEELEFARTELLFPASRG